MFLFNSLVTLLGDEGDEIGLLAFEDHLEFSEKLLHEEVVFVLPGPCFQEQNISLPISPFPPALWLSDAVMFQRERQAMFLLISSCLDELECRDCWVGQWSGLLAPEVLVSYIRRSVPQPVGDWQPGRWTGW